jgi:hypothetical protein
MKFLLSAGPRENRTIEKIDVQVSASNVSFSESPYQKTVPAKISVYLDLSLLIDRVLKREKGIKIGFFQKGPIFAENGPNSSIFNQIKHFKIFFSTCFSVLYKNVLTKFGHFFF